MKIKEVQTKTSKSQLNELQLSSLIGDYGAAQMKQGFGAGGGRTKQDIMTQNIFIKNFVSNALTSLKSAIQSGIVDPKKKTIPKAQAGDFEKRVQPKTATAGDIGDFDLKDKLAKEKEAKALAAKDKEAGDVAAARVARAAASPTSPEASAAVDARLQRATQAQQAQTSTPSSVDDKLEKAAAQRTQTQQPKVSPSSKVRKSELFNPLKVVPNKTTESTYDRLNQVFEKILNEAVAAPDEDTSTYGIEQYLKDVWFPNYMKGVDTTANTQKIDQIVKQVADSYPKDGGRAALTQLANLSFAISPKKTKPQPKQNAQPANAADQEVAAAAQEEQPAVVSIGKDKYTKGKRGWMNDKKQLVSAAMAQTLDQLSQVQSSKDDEKAEPDRQQQLPFSGSTTDGNVTTLRRTGTNESKKRKKNESNRINKITKR